MNIEAKIDSLIGKYTDIIKENNKLLTEHHKYAKGIADGVRTIGEIILDDLKELKHLPVQQEVECEHKRDNVMISKCIYCGKFGKQWTNDIGR